MEQTTGKLKVVCNNPSRCKKLIVKAPTHFLTLKPNKVGLEGTSSFWDAVVSIMFNTKRLNTILGSLGKIKKLHDFIFLDFF